MAPGRVVLCLLALRRLLRREVLLLGFWGLGDTGEGILGEGLVGKACC